jgi:hypothetical protein
MGVIRTSVNGAGSVSGGGGGIRTHGPREGTTVFETVPIDHSGTPPQEVAWLCKAGQNLAESLYTRKLC